MHELGIAEAVVRLASEQGGGRRVAKVEMTIGHLRQVVPTALEFNFELVALGTSVEGAELEVRHVPAGGRCRECGEESELELFPFCCTACRSLDVEVIRGEELTVEAIELEQAVATTSGGVAR